MFQPLYVAATGLSTLEDEMLNITNNLSNAQTVGFKKSNTEMESLSYIQKSFKDMLNEAMSEDDINAADIVTEYGTGVRVAATPHDFTQGVIQTTSNPLNIAIQGNGFLEFLMPDGTKAYGRAGNLQIDVNGNLVDPNGHKIQPEIIFRPETTAIVIKQDGTVSVALNSSDEYSDIGQINLVKFANPVGLKSIGQNLLQKTEESGEPIYGIPGEEGFGTVNQYALEQANVDVLSEMMRMVMVQRVFDTITKAVASYEGMLTSLDKMKS